MFTTNVSIYGIYGEKAKKLKEIGLFDRIIDVYMSAAVVGIIFSKKGVKKTEQSSVKVFVEQLNNELPRIKYLSSVAFLIENAHMKGNDVTEKELLRQTFGDWFGESDEDSSKKYDLFELYALAGIEILYDKIVANNTDKDSYYENFYRFIGEIGELEIINDMDRTFAGVLNV